MAGAAASEQQPEAAAEAPLPPGWEEAKAPDGRPYYYQTGSSATQWNRPTTTASTGGALYDDEIPESTKPPVSEAMRQRLINESRGLGSDPNQSNPFLAVFFGFGVFVVLGFIAVNT